MSIKTYADKDIQSTLISRERLQARITEMGVLSSWLASETNCF